MSKFKPFPFMLWLRDAAAKRMHDLIPAGMKSAYYIQAAREKFERDGGKIIMDAKQEAE